MATIEIGGLPPSDVYAFLETLKEAATLIDTLAQMQAMVGGLSMQSRAHRTEEVLSMIRHYSRHLENQQIRVNR